MSKKKGNIVKVTSILLICLLTNTSLSNAHSGRTDANGGHKDNKNKSGLGSYHYHHGYGPHLHNNGCPYAGGTSSSSSNTSSNSGNSSSSGGTSSSSQSKENQQKQIELAKEKVRTKGFNAGYSAGYNGKECDSSYTGEHSDAYESKYNEGYESGKAKLEDEEVKVKEKGYNLGLDGSKINEEQYENEILNIAFKESYDEGFEQYKVKKTDEYTQLGLKHGQEDKEMIKINDEDKVFEQSYKEAYNHGQELLANTYIEEGYNEALKGIQYTKPNYKKSNYVDWYKTGFDKGVTDIESATQIGYEDGYSSNEINIPEGLEACEKVYLENYEKGKIKADEDTANSVASMTSIAGVGWLIRRFLEAKKSIR